jgi:HD-GYP domain-containing protein (c-di-GMP phosphodiesterase class II)
MMNRQRKKRSLFTILYSKLLGYALLVALVVYAGTWFFAQSVVYHDTHIMEYLITKNTEITLSMFDKILQKEELSTENHLLTCLSYIDNEEIIADKTQCSDVVELILSPTGTVILSNSTLFSNISFDDFPFFSQVASVTSAGKIASPRAFIPGLADGKTFYKFIFAPIEDGKLLALGTEVHSDINLKMILRSSVEKIVNDIDVVQNIEIIYPNKIYSPLPKEIQNINITPDKLFTIEQSNIFESETRFLMVPEKRTLISVWLTSLPKSSRADIVYIPQPYIIYLTLDFTPLLKEFSVVMFLITIGVIIFLTGSGLTAFLITKHISHDIQIITKALEEWKTVDKKSPQAIADFLKHLKNELLSFKSNALEIEEMTETFEETIEEFLETQRQLVYNNILLEDAYKELEEKQQSLKRAYYFFARRLARLAEQFDNETGEHIVRVGEYSAFIAEKLGMREEFIEDIRRFAPLHDIGKILIPQHILRKPGPLTKEEWEIMKKHTIYGWEILGGEEENEMEMAKNIARWHHEKYNGCGYPDKLKGNEIPLEARIVALADIYDALRSPRPYKKALKHNEVVNIILKGDGRVMPEHFDPEILDIFARYHKVFDEIYENNLM